MAILEERGLFWWAHDPIPEKQFAPAFGALRHSAIDDDDSRSPVSTAICQVNMARSAAGGPATVPQKRA